MLFLVWFCCYIACKDRNAKLCEQRVKRSIKETETNLNSLGFDLNKLSTNKHNDSTDPTDFEYLTLTTLPNKSNQIQEKNADEVYSHQYDIVDPNQYLNKTKTTSIKKQKLIEKLNPQVNEAFVADEEEDQVKNKPNTSKQLTIAKRPRLTASQIEREFYDYTLECSRRFGDMLNSDVQSNTISLDTRSFDYMESSTVSPNRNRGIYSHNLKVKNKNRISHVRTSFNNDNKNMSSKIRILKVKANNGNSADQIWQI